MLKLNKIVKVYQMQSMKVEALKGVSLAFRKSEFVSILGPSGCGKTTLLNIIGGLDKYTAGDLVIAGKSTKTFTDKDWDVYRNHRIGFIFQAYNLIPHQTILQNVELALTIGGIAKEERQKKAKEALDMVGLKDMYNKKPNQLSGGQCQRVAIARALVNEPDILLADEPTGALDTKTSVQIMELIKEISKNKLVIMVTHNPELAEAYSTRIVKLLDGNVIEDSKPYSFSDEEKEVQNLDDKEKNLKNKTKMSWFNSFKLSMRNLLSKSKRTILTCIAGSIGIVGISAVLAVSSGVKGYVYNMQDDMLSGNPISIEESAYDLTSIMTGMSMGEKVEAVIKNGIVNVDSLIKYIASMVDSENGMLIDNDINKDYVQYLKDMPAEYTNAISMRYGVNLSNNIFTDYTDYTYKLDENGQPLKDSNGEYIKETRTREISISGINATYTSVLGSTDFADYAQMITSLTSPLMQSLPNEDYLLSQYDVKAGKVATNKNELMIVINSKQELVDLVLAQMGYYTQEEFIDMAMNYDNENYEAKIEFTFDELMNKKFTYYPNNDIYAEIDYSEIVKKIEELLKFPLLPEDYKDQLTLLRDFLQGASPFAYRSENKVFNLGVAGLDIPTYPKFQNGLELEVVGILMPKEGRLYSSLQSGFYYTEDLVNYSIEVNKNTPIINYAKENGDENGNYVFGIQNNNTRMMSQHIPHFYDYTPWLDPKNPDTINAKGSGMSILLPNSSNSINGMIDAMLGGSDSTSIGPEMRELGGKTEPNSVYIYPVTFEEKYLVTDYLDAWNEEGDITLSNGKVLKLEERTQIKYQDNLEMVIAMINGMVDMVTIALICFTALSLVVSCVMIAIITYVSVMERVKEIGVIRSLGGRKKDVSNLFNAETMIIGTISGAIGIAVTYLLSLIINLIVSALTGIYPIAALPWWQALIMALVSIILNAISGFIPARSAAKKDPATALRTE